MSAVNVLILAGQREGVIDPLLENTSTNYKALLPILGIPMIDYVLSALDDAKNLSRPYWISGIDKAYIEHELLQAPKADGPASSVVLSFETCLKPPFLVTTCDHALLTSEMVDLFLEKSLQTDADFTLALAEKETIQPKYPNVKRTYLKFKGEDGKSGHVSGCNLFFVKNQNGLQAIRFWQKAQNDRKRPIKLAARVGFGLLLKYITGNLTLKQAFNTSSKRLGIHAEPIILPIAEAAIDVDKPSDLTLVENILKGEV